MPKFPPALRGLQEYSRVLVRGEGFTEIANGLDEHISRAASILREEKAPLKWRPISTAPRDGRPVWLFQPGEEFGKRQYVGYWEDDRRYQAGGCWKYADRDYVGQPTHWMPRPEDPKQ